MFWPQLFIKVDSLGLPLSVRLVQASLPPDRGLTLRFCRWERLVRGSDSLALFTPLLVDFRYIEYLLMYPI